MQRSDHSGKASRRRYVDVAQSLLTAVATGEFAVGDRLPPDRDIAVRCNVSRPTAREALLVLELIGAVEIRHGDGVYVQGPQARVGGIGGSGLDVPPRELIESRRVLEPQVAGLAADRAEAEAVEAIQRDLDEAGTLVDDFSRTPRFIELGLKFHSDVARAGGNALLGDLVGQLVDVESHPLWMLVNLQAMSTVEARTAQITEHREVVAALVAGDREGAAKAMAAHLGGLENAIFFPVTAAPASS